MIEVTIFLKTVQSAVELSGILSKYPYDIDMVRSRDVIDAKSLLGVLGLGVGRETKLQINTEEADELIQELGRYRCDV